MSLDPQDCIETCCVDGRTIIVAGEEDFLVAGETYYVMTRCEEPCPDAKVESVYFYTELTKQREYFTNLGEYESDYQIFEYIASEAKRCPHLVIEANCCAEFFFSRINPLFYGNTYELADQMVVGPGETVMVVQYQQPSDCVSVTTSISASETIITTTYEEIFVRGGGFRAVEEFSSNVTSVIAINTLEDTFNEDFTLKGIDLVSDIELITYEDDLDRIRNINLKALEEDRRRDYTDLPAQPIENKLIMLNIPFDESYDRLFEEGTRYLRKSSLGDLTTMLIPEDGFLGVSAFKHNFVVFDPRPYVATQAGERPLFPGYDPIYNKRTYEEILEHIYTTVYPSNRIPAFPNFRIGDIAINGEIYNPMYDYRNFRLFGSYDYSNNSANEDIFVAEPLTTLDSRFVTGRYVKIGSNYYRIARDYYNSGAKNTSIFGEVIQKVLPVNTKFEKISKTVYDLNSALHIAL